MKTINYHQRSYQVFKFYACNYKRRLKSELQDLKIYEVDGIKLEWFWRLETKVDTNMTTLEEHLLSML